MFEQFLETMLEGKDGDRAGVLFPDRLDSTKTTMHSVKQDRQEQPRSIIHFGDRPQNILITGATGFIGQQLTDALLKDGHRVTVLTRRPSQATSLFEAKVRCVTSMKNLTPDDRFDVIINLAGARILGWHWTAARKATLRKSRIELTRTVIDWIARAEIKPHLMLSASAIGYYGIQAPGDHTLLAEDAPPQSIFMSQLCQEWEAIAGQAASHGVHTICMRFGLVLGRQGALPMMIMPIKLGVGGTLGRGSQWFSWIHVHDLIRGIAHLCQLHARGTSIATSEAFNFTAPQAVTQQQFNEISARTVHRPNWLPMPALLIRAMLGEQADLLLEGQRVIPRKLNETGFSFDYPDLQSALRDLG